MGAWGHVNLSRSIDTCIDDLRATRHAPLASRVTETDRAVAPTERRRGALTVVPSSVAGPPELPVEEPGQDPPPVEEPGKDPPPAEDPADPPPAEDPGDPAPVREPDTPAPIRDPPAG